MDEQKLEEMIRRSPAVIQQTKLHLSDLQTKLLELEGMIDGDTNPRIIAYYTQQFAGNMEELLIDFTSFYGDLQ